MGTFVCVKDSCLVAPSEPTPSCVLSLSAVDSQLFLRFTIEYLLVYKPSSSLDPAAICGRVKSALSDALVAYYPLSGRVRYDPNGSGKLEVFCEAQGALFVEAVSDYTMAEFETAPRLVKQWRKLLLSDVEDVLEGSPPLVVQLTWLREESHLAVGIGFNHCICDGIGSAEFLNSFAELATGNSELSEVKRRPVWARHLLDPKPPTKVDKSLTELPKFNRVPDLCGFMARFSNEPLVPTSITFDKTSLTQLKSLAQPSCPLNDLSSSYTSFEILSAHIWRSWARALNLPKNQILKLLFSVNIRKRVYPTLPDGYYGNAFVLGCAQSSVKDIVEKGLGHVAGLIKRAKERVDEEQVRAVIESVSRSRARPDSVGVLILSQWSRLGLERIDFGIGRPVHVGPICCDRYCLLLPVYYQNDALKVMLAVPESSVDNYRSLIAKPNT